MDKKENKFEVVKDENDKLTIDDRITIKELEDKIAGMKADKEKKCKLAKDQLIEMLEVTVDKYRTATGTAEALRVMRFVYGENTSDLIPAIFVCVANELAREMASITQEMAEKAKKLSYANMDQLCDGFYDKDLELDEDNGSDVLYVLCMEMMKIDLCRNVGGTAEDMVEFIKRVEADIDDTGKQLKELKAKEN